MERGGVGGEGGAEAEEEKKAAHEPQTFAAGIFRRNLATAGVWMSP